MDDENKMCACGLHWGHTGKHAPETAGIAIEDDDTDEGEMWAGYREERREKKKSNIESSLRILQERGIEVKTLNAGGAHYRVGDWDFWPSTGKFYNPKTGERGRGVFNLIKKL